MAGGVGPCNLNSSPRHNWVENAGGLPNYICHVARAIHRSRGMPLEHAIPAAIQTVKRWAAGGGGVSASVKGKAAAAVAAWEALKSKAHAKGTGKHVTHASEHVATAYELSEEDQAVVLSQMEEGAGILTLTLSVPPPRQGLAKLAAAYDVSSVGSKYMDMVRNQRSYWAQYGSGTGELPYFHIKNVWVDSGSGGYLIVDTDSSTDECYKVPFSITPEGEPEFDSPVPVRLQQEYVELDDSDEPSDSSYSSSGDAPMKDPVPALARKAASALEKLALSRGIDLHPVPSPQDFLELTPANISQEQRDKWAKDGSALSDGSWPIPNAEYLSRAIQSWGRSGGSSKVKSHIRKRALVLGKSEAWVKEHVDTLGSGGASGKSDSED